MLRRQQHTDDHEGAPPARLTDETDEFEVYERPGGDSEQEEPESARTPAPQPDAHEGPAVQRDLFEELPGRDQEEDIPIFQDENDAEPELRPEPRPDSLAAPHHEPTQVEAPAHAAPRRPQVFPPLRREEAMPAAPQTAHPTPAAPATHAPGPAPTSAPERRPVGGDGCRIGLVHCTFNHQITDRMVDSARDTAETLGASIIETLQVSGVYDAPFAAQLLARRPDVDAVVVVGAVIKGDTDHDALITHAAAKALLDVSLREQVPVGLGVTGPGMSWTEAEARIGNAGHAVEAAIVQWRLLQTA